MMSVKRGGGGGGGCPVVIILLLHFDSEQLPNMMLSIRARAYRD